jgi:hypothetical protein
LRGQPVGKVHRVLVLETGGFDGIVVKTDAGTRFVDAPEVRRISAGAVTLGITVDDVVNPGPNARRIYGMPEARECLKRAYCRDELTTDELADRVGIAHLAETLDELDAAVADVSIS